MTPLTLNPKRLRLGSTQIQHRDCQKYMRIVQISIEIAASVYEVCFVLVPVMGDDGLTNQKILYAYIL